MSTAKQPITQAQLEGRQQEALSVAEQCSRILRERFGAEQVILFGSLAGDGPWHWNSDLDLAVTGLSSEALWEAQKQLEAVLPAWLTIDLVSLEKVYPEVKARILRTKPMSDHKYLALKDRLENELISLERVAQGLEAALERVGTTPDEFATRALITYLDDFYKGCERIAERVAVTLDGGLPQGENWHQLLLGQMGESKAEERPALWSGLLLLELDEYRRFRHRVRHIYGYELEAQRVLSLARRVKPLVANIKQAVTIFTKRLESQASL